MWRLLLVLTLTAVVDRRVAQQIPKTNFSCKGRNTGYYADISTGCQVYHMCDGLGRQFSYTCPNATLFQQRMLICDHWYMVNCSKAEDDYSANLLIGQKKPFVEDYVRTPRPDLLNPGESEYNIIYRAGRAQTDSIKNLVGAEERTKSDQTSSTEETEYFPPSHWSTDYRDQTTTPTTIVENRRISKDQPTNKIRYYQTSYHTINKKVEDSFRPQAKAIDLDSTNKDSNSFFGDIKPKPFRFGSESFKVNFESNFKATTPVYPKSVEATSDVPDDVGLLPPGDFSEINIPEFIINVPHVNFESDFKATTPVYPLSVEASSPDPGEVGLIAPGSLIDQTQQQQPSDVSDVHVNFESNFKATTPVYPKSVEATSPNPDNVGLLAPSISQDDEKSINDVHINFESQFKATTPVYPKFVEPTSPDPNDIGLLAPQDSDSDSEKEFSHQHVNFESNFKATTPVYPKSVEPTSPNPNEIGLVPPQSNDTVKEIQENEKTTVQVVPTLNLSFEPPAFDTSYLERNDTVPATEQSPSVYYQPPKLEPDFTINKAVPVPLASNGLFLKPDYTQRMRPEQWNMLREILHIPNYNFPLEPVTRPSYESGFDSFQAKPALKR